jgi:Concanavalin A-like lectin/glucanases superfamily
MRRIGARNDGLYFDGMIDDVRVYDRALTATEVQQLYSEPAQTTPAVPASPPTGSTSGATPTTGLTSSATPSTPPAGTATTPAPVITERPDPPTGLDAVVQQRFDGNPQLVASL